jgi:signal transduction histidine kinase
MDGSMEKNRPMSRLEKVLRDLGAASSVSTELGWIFGRYAMIGVVALDTALFIEDRSTFWFLWALFIAALFYNTLFWVLLSGRRVFHIFICGMVLDNAAVLSGWWKAVDGQSGALITNDLYLSLFPVLGIGVARLGPWLGVVYTALWMAWVTVTTLRFYPDGSYDVEQLPIRLLFLGITSALVMLLVHHLNRERQQVQALNRDLEGRVAERTLELAEANKEMEAFSYSVAHDLRSPLTVIRGFAELLEMQDDALQDPKYRDYLRHIVTEAKRSESTIEDLFRLSRMFREEIKKEAVDLSKLVLDVAYRLQQRDANRKATINVGPAVVAHCDPGLMRRAWRTWWATPRSTRRCGTTRSSSSGGGTRMAARWCFM